MVRDIVLYESRSGGEFRILNGDLLLGNTLFQSVYLCLFGGNKRSNYWGNSFLSTDRQSDTERILMDTPINSAGRLAIQGAVTYDLQVLSNIATFVVDVSLLGIDRVGIRIGLSQGSESFNLIWDSARQEVIIDM